jgi:transmembrane sensor
VHRTRSFAEEKELTDAAAGGVTSAKDVDACAAGWVQRRYFWEWSEQDQADFNTWLAQSLAHRAAYLRLEAVWRRTERLAALRSQDSREISSSKRGRLRRLLTGTALGLAIAVALGAGVVQFLNAPHVKTYQTTVGGHETLTFQDGSQIELNTDTVLRAAINSDQRMVWLDRGEAYFQIVHDPKHPLVVMAAGHRVTDIGTKFLIRRDSDRLEVMLVEGRAGIDTPQGPAASRTLKPGDIVLATPNSVSFRTKSAQALSDELGWQHGVLVFHHTTLADAAAEFNRYNDRKLVIADKASARLTIVGTFRTNDLAGFVDVSQSIFGLRIEKRGNETVISR